MLNLRKNTLALAVAAAATLGGGISAVQAQQVLPPPAVPPAPQYVAANNLGQALIYPYFTVRDGWRTFIHVTNTSANTVAAKVRILSARESFDLLDFVLVLSPYDMWTAVIEERGGQPGIRATDNSCTVPAIGSGNFVPFRTVRFPTTPPTDWLREGYAEIIQMGIATLETSDIPVAAKHGASGIPAACPTVVSGFSATNIATTRGEFGYPAGVNVLAGKFDLINTSRAYAGASRAVPIANFSTAAPNLIYGQFNPEWDYPNLANTTVPAPTILTQAQTDTGIVPVNAALAAISISNEWVLNPGINELSSWVVTFPTKYLTPEGTAPFTGLTGGGCPTGFTAKSVPVNIALFNREEITTVDIDFSPGAGPSEFCFETNVVNFTAGALSSAGLLNSVVAKTINVDGLASPFLGGWARLNHALAPTGVVMPAVGFNLTARSNADGDSAVLYDHVYEGRRQVPPAP